MSLVSVIIPARNEIFLQQTVSDLLSKASGDVEVIVVLDGYWPNPQLLDDKRLIILHRGKSHGMRSAINSAATIAKGKWLLKTDAHCMFAEGYDEELQKNCDDDWIVVPRRYRLDAENWCIREDNKSPIDYHYLSCPMTNPDGFSMHGVVWSEMTRSKMNNPECDLDDLMSFQGSCWFMNANHFHNFLGGMDEEYYGIFSQEPQEIGNKTWLGGGRVVVNKKTWYAHLHKGKQYGRMYSISKNDINPYHEKSARFWMSNSWVDRKYDIECLVDKFWPVPSWPEDWKETYDRGNFTPEIQS